MPSRGAQLQRALRARGHLAAAHRLLAARRAGSPSGRGARASRRRSPPCSPAVTGRSGGCAASERTVMPAGPGESPSVERHLHRVGADVARAVAHPHLHDVDARRDRLAARPAVPLPAPQAGRAAPLGDELRLAGVGADDAEARRAARRDPRHEDRHQRRHRAHDLARPDLRHARARRLGVERDQPRVDDGAALLEQAPAHAVDAVGGQRAVVGAPVPAHADRRGRAGSARSVTSRRTGLPAASTRSAVSTSASRTRSASVGAVLAPVAVGREPALAVQLHDRRRALQPLGHEEGAERRRHEGEEDDAGEGGHGRPARAAGPAGGATATAPCPGRGSPRRRRPR